MNIGLRLKELRETRGLTLEQVGEFVGVNKATVLRYESGEIDIKRTMAIKLSECLNVTPAFIMGWTDNPNKEISSPRQGIRIPILGNVAAGIPIEAVEDILDYEEITPELAATGDFFALKIRGDSMAPRMLNGDVVIIRQQDDADTGDVAVVLVNGDAATVKKIRKQADGLSLIPINPTYDIMFYTPEEVRHLPVRIIGKVVELRGKL